MTHVRLFPKSGDKENLNCPNCGAPLEGIQCRYCGTYMYNVADLSAEKPTFIRLNLGGQWVMLRVLVTEFDLHNNSEPMSLYADDTVLKTVTAPEWTLHMDMHVVPDEYGIYARKKIDETLES